jgi:RNA polymerase sigma-70 factor (ECF subfamily)
VGRRSHVAATSDETLVGSIARGDKQAMRLLFARHNVRVFRFLVRIVNNEATAEDLLNEVFLEVWRSAKRFEGRSLVTTWLLGIARFKALSDLRRRLPDALDDETAERMEDPADGPESVMQNRDRTAVLQSCISQLSDAHRQVIDLVYYHEQSIEEVAQIIGVPANTVKTRVFHARKRIAELMAARGLERAAL